jgi:hypothetical protein
MRMSQFIIGTILAALIMTSFALILADANDEYTISQYGYNSSTLETFDRLDTMHSLSENISNRVTNKTTEKDLYDVVGGFISDARDSLMVAAISVDVFHDVSRKGMKEARVPEIYITAFTTIIIIIVFLGIILTAIIKWKL